MKKVLLQSPGSCRENTVAPSLIALRSLSSWGGAWLVSLRGINWKTYI